ncbi:M3 family metallopeptidase [Pseudoclavibacter sp. 13-3]|uniref:M3 family metallopeptidase n=1 Tax=Pseudoclavibacter sp. 13-3 TaxID=2901228 RepID=UPI001E2F022D|nr:M3 family metallopeptidase [Pseudoclavibacter sp. 13-3]MCD7101715.1 M3 family metallopeptidase [Pseudoclavibacter sp. 13-3]
MTSRASHPSSDLLSQRLLHTGLPYGLPDFATIGEDDYEPAISDALVQHDREIAHIIDSDEAATFENTIVALERSGHALDRVLSVFFNLTSTDGTPALLDLEERMSSVLSEHYDAISLNPRLFERVQAVYEQLDELTLDAESRWLVERTHLGFVRAGAGLESAAQQHLREINAELSTLSTRFGTRLLDDSNALGVVFDDPAELDGLNEAELAAASAAAEEAGYRGRHMVALVLPSGHPWLSKLTVRATRERILRASLERGAHGGPNDTRAIAVRIAQLRAHRAELLGYANHAEYVLADETAGSLEAADTLLQRLAPAAMANARDEARELQKLIDEADADEADGATGCTLQPYDWPYYTELRRKREFDIDAEALSEYFEVERVLRDGVFYAAEQLYGVHLEERPDLHGYHPAVRVFEVSRTPVAEADAAAPSREAVGLFLLDLYARPTKRGGAWMSSFVDQSRLLNERAIVVNVLNLVKPPEGEPTLLSLDEVHTLFHEFGHGLHGLLSDVRYPQFSGTNVPRDFVELPSQFNETWALHPAVLPHYAKHVRTGEVIPQQLIDRLKAAGTFNQGYETTEYLQASVIDLAWHSLSAAAADALVEPAAEADDDEVVSRFEQQALLQRGLASNLVLPRYRTSFFQHIFSGGYSAGYYSYIWSEVLDADTEQWFAEHGGLSREAGEHYRRELLTRGGSQDTKKTYVEFRGADAAIEPLLKRRGLAARVSH